MNDNNMFARFYGQKSEEKLRAIALDINYAEDALRFKSLIPC